MHLRRFTGQAHCVLRLFVQKQHALNSFLIHLPVTGCPAAASFEGGACEALNPGERGGASRQPALSSSAVCPQTTAAMRTGYKAIIWALYQRVRPGAPQQGRVLRSDYGSPGGCQASSRRSVRSWQQAELAAVSLACRACQACKNLCETTTLANCEIRTRAVLWQLPVQLPPIEAIPRVNDVFVACLAAASRIRSMPSDGLVHVSSQPPSLAVVGPEA